MDPFDIEDLVKKEINVRQAILNLLKDRFKSGSVVRDISNGRMYLIDLTSPASVFVGATLDGEDMLSVKCESPYKNIVYLNYLHLEVVCSGGVSKSNFYKV